MPIKDLFSRIFGKKRQVEALQIDSSASIDSKAIQKRSESLENDIMPEGETPISEPTSIELQKDSLQLGLAAGYTGRSLRGIESSLIRIESQIPSKDWFLAIFEGRIQELINLFRIHDENEHKRFESMQSILISLQRSAEKAPEPLKSELMYHVRAIESQLPLTPKMKELLEFVRQAGEISYDELHIKLNITVPALRGLLANMTKRTSQIERFEKDGKGWVKYKEKIDSIA